MRSSCLRLRRERVKGPKSIQLNEFANQLNQYDSVLNWNWKENGTDLASFIGSTLKLIQNRESISTFSILVMKIVSNVRNAVKILLIKKA